MQKLRTNTCVNKWSWVDFAGALQSVTLTFLAFSFLRITCRKLLAIHHTVVDTSDVYTTSKVSVVFLQIPLSISLNLAFTGVVVGACVLAYFKSGRMVTTVFGLFNVALVFFWIAIALSIGSPMILH